MEDITVTELKALMDEGKAPKVIDVREVHEYEEDHIDAVNIPLATIPVRLEELGVNKDEEFIVACRSGGRSGQAKMYLKQQGYDKVRNLTGGMLAWKDQVDPSFNVE